MLAPEVAVVLADVSRGLARPAAMGGSVTVAAKGAVEAAGVSFAACCCPVWKLLELKSTYIQHVLVV